MSLTQVARVSHFTENCHNISFTTFNIWLASSQHPIYCHTGILAFSCCLSSLRLLFACRRFQYVTKNHDDDRPFSHRYCSCAVNSRPHPWVPSAGWLIIPHLKKQLTSNGLTYYGLISLILAWAKLSPYVMRRFPGRVRIVYRLGRRLHIQGCCQPFYLPFRTKTTYVRRSIRRGAGHRWNTPLTHHLRGLKIQHRLY